MRYLLIAIWLIITSCQSQLVNKVECQEIRKGKLSNTFTRTDRITRETDGIIRYDSNLDIERGIDRNWVFPKWDSKDSLITYEIDRNEIRCKLLEKKIVQINGENFLIIKYSIEESGSSDSQSYKFYSPEFGVIVETFWRKNYIKMTKFNAEVNNELNRLVQEILTDSVFMWRLK